MSDTQPRRTRAGEADEKGTGTTMAYDLHSNQRYVYVEMHRREMYAAVAAARLERQARGPRRARRYVGALLIAAGEALAYQAHDTACAECALAPATPVRKHW